MTTKKNSALSNISKQTPIVQQVRESFSRKRLLATCAGFLLGGFVPLASYTLAHYQVDFGSINWSHPSNALAPTLVGGGLVYSAKTVYQWGVIAFQNAWKSFGFVVLIEGVMVAADAKWLAVSALVYLIVINGLATGCNLSREKTTATTK